MFLSTQSRHCGCRGLGKALSRSVAHGSHMPTLSTTLPSDFYPFPVTGGPHSNALLVEHPADRAKRIANSFHHLRDRQPTLVKLRSPLGVFGRYSLPPKAHSLGPQQLKKPGLRDAILPTQCWSMLASVVPSYQFRDLLWSKTPAKAPHRSARILRGSRARLHQSGPLGELCQLTQRRRRQRGFI